MAADRPRAPRPDGTPAVRRAPVLAALLAAGLLAGAPAPAASDPNGEHAGGGRDDAGAVSPAAGGRGPDPGAQAAPAPAAAPEAPAEARRDREATAPVAPAPQVAASGAATASAAPSGGGGDRGGRSRSGPAARGPLRRPAASPDAAPSPAPAPARTPAGSSAPAPVAVAAAAPPAPPASSPRPSSSSSTSSRRSSAARRARAARQLRAARRRAAARTRARAAARAAAGAAAVTIADPRRGEQRLVPVPLPSAGVTVSRAPSAAAPAGIAAPAGRRLGAAAPEQAGDSGITRTVVQVLEVIPLRLRVAVAALGALGLVLGGAALVQGRRVRRLEHQRGRLAADVGVLQSALLPELPATIGGARVTAAYRPAEGLAGGGDFFDGFELPDGRTAVLVGDVAGHGREVVPTTALVRYSLRAYLEAGLEPRAALAVASEVLGPQLDGRLVTVAVAIFDPGAGRLTFACAGHWPPTLLGVRDVPVMVCSSPPLGAGVPTGRRQTTLALPPGAAACLHTDGLADVLVGADRLGMEGVAAELAAAGPQAGAGELLDRVVRLSDVQPDDMAVCVLEALPGGGDGAGPRLETLEVDLALLRGTRVARFLEACGVPAGEITVTLAAARELCARAGSAILEVRMDAAGAAVAVAPPAPRALPLARPAGPAALAAAG